MRDDRGDGLYHNLNIPFSVTGVKDNHLIDILHKIKHRLTLFYQPNAVIITLGCDGLQNDPKSKFNLTSDGYVECIKIILDTIDVPTVILGGGGYNPTETARTWLKVVSMCCNDYEFLCQFYLYIVSEMYLICICIVSDM